MSKSGYDNSPLCSIKESEYSLPYHIPLLPLVVSEVGQAPTAVWAISARLGLLGSCQ